MLIEAEKVAEDWVYAHGDAVLENALAFALVLGIFLLLRKGVRSLSKWKRRKDSDAALMASLRQADAACRAAGSSQT